MLSLCSNGWDEQLPMFRHLLIFLVLQSFFVFLINHFIIGDVPKSEA